MCQPRIRPWFAAVVLLACVWTTQVGAAALQLEPVAIRLTPTARSAVMTLSNHGSEALHVQVRAFRWEQSDGEDRLSETSALRVSPPIQEIPPGGEQIVRILLAEDVTPMGEESFRLIVDQLPNAPAAEGDVQLLIRYSVPVTLRPAHLTPAELQFRLSRANGHTILEAVNSGGQSARLSNLQVTMDSGDTLDINAGLFGYVLAGRLRRWQLESKDVADFDQIDGIVANVDGQTRAFAIEVVQQTRAFALEVVH